MELFRLELVHLGFVGPLLRATSDPADVFSKSRPRGCTSDVVALHAPFECTEPLAVWPRGHERHLVALDGTFERELVQCSRELLASDA